MRYPTLFVSHGAPTLALETTGTAAFFAGLGQQLPRPKAIVCVSAHWESDIVRVGASPAPETVHDFYGFPAPLYALRYPAPGEPALARRIVERLVEAGFSAELAPQRGLDHGVWVPLSLMYPAADIPVVPVSLQTGQGPAHHLALGRALRGLREEDVLILGSGGATHDLGGFGRYAAGAPPADYAAAFDTWLEEVVQGGDETALDGYLAQAPQARRNHPTPEHFLPLSVPMGARLPEETGRRIHDGFTYATLSMAAYLWE